MQATRNTMLDIYTAEDKIQNLPVVCVRVKDPSEEQVTDELEAKVLQDWTAAYDAHPKFWFMVDLRSVTMVGAFHVVPRVVKILKAFRDRSAVQVITTGIILTSLAEPLVKAVTALYPPTRPIVNRQTPGKVGETNERAA